MDYLKSKEHTFSFGALTIHQLPAIAQIEMLDSREKPFEAALIVCRWGAFPDKTTAEIARTMPLAVVQEIAAAVMDFSGLDAKNSETDQGESSSSG